MVPSYTATDASGNEGTATRTVNVTDTTAPVDNFTDNQTATVDCVSSVTFKVYSRSYTDGVLQILWLLIHTKSIYSN